MPEEDIRQRLRRPVNDPVTLQETRIQGTASFPCTIYEADSESRGTDSPFIVNPHWHNAIEILYFERGHYLLSIDMNVMEIREEAVCFVNPGSLHNIRTLRDDGESWDFSQKVILFEPRFFEAAKADDAGTGLIEPLQRSHMLFPPLVTPDNPAFAEVRDMFLNIFSIFKDYGQPVLDQRLLSGMVPQLRVRASFMNMLAALEDQKLLLRQYREEDYRVSAMKEVMTYVRNNYTERIYLKDLAAIMNMNEQYFCRFFKKSIGVTPVAYINEYRIRQAIRMLEGGEDFSVADVAYANGFGNMGHFIEEFRRHTGTTPLEYRRKTRNSREEVKIP